MKAFAFILVFHVAFYTCSSYMFTRILTSKHFLHANKYIRCSTKKKLLRTHTNQLFTTFILIRYFSFLLFLLLPFAYSFYLSIYFIQYIILKTGVSVWVIGDFVTHSHLSNSFNWHFGKEI